MSTCLVGPDSDGGCVSSMAKVAGRLGLVGPSNGAGVTIFVPSGSFAAAEPKMTRQKSAVPKQMRPTIRDMTKNEHHGISLFSGVCTT